MNKIAGRCRRNESGGARRRKRRSSPACVRAATRAAPQRRLAQRTRLTSRLRREDAECQPGGAIRRTKKDRKRDVLLLKAHHAPGGDAAATHLPRQSVTREKPPHHTQLQGGSRVTQRPRAVRARAGPKKSSSRRTRIASMARRSPRSLRAGRAVGSNAMCAPNGAAHQSFDRVNKP